MSDGFSYIGAQSSRTRVDRIRSIYLPINYTRNPAGYVEHDEHLLSHLQGIDDELGSLGGGKLGDAYASITGDTGGGDVATGADTIDFRGGTGISIDADTVPPNAIVTVTNTAPFVSHASSHTRGGSDPVDADEVDIDFSPSAGYSPETGSPGSSAEHLAAHLRGIASALDDLANTIAALGTDDIENDSEATGATATDALNWLKNRIGQLSRWAVGNRFFASNVNRIDTATNGNFSGRVWYTPLFIPEDYPLNRMSIQLVSGADVTLNARLAVYEDVDGNPSDLLYDSGNMNMGVNTVRQTTTAMPSVSAGQYWFGFQAQSNALNFRCILAAAVGPYIGEKDGSVTPPPVGNSVTMRSQAQAFGAFPATASGTLTDHNNANVPLIGISRLAI